jgi:hypothetical protein
MLKRSPMKVRMSLIFLHHGHDVANARIFGENLANEMMDVVNVTAKCPPATQ